MKSHVCTKKLLYQYWGPSQSSFLPLFFFNFVLFFVDILNLRGCDIPYNPVFIAYLLINFSSTTSGILFIDSQKVAEPIRLYLKDLNIEIREYGKILEVLKEVDQTVYMDGNQCSYAINQAVKENLRKNAVSPIEIMKVMTTSNIFYLQRLLKIIASNKDLETVTKEML